MTYSIPGSYVHQRQQIPQLQYGSVTPGPDTYSWTAHEMFGATRMGPTTPITTQWQITYTFSGNVPANTIYVGAMGIGRASEPVAGDSLVTVNPNGTFLGDWSGGGNWGPTLFTGGASRASLVPGGRRLARFRSVEGGVERG